MKYVLGDLIKIADTGDFDIIVQGCNCFNTMGGGIAASIRERAPQAYAADCATNKGDRKKLGSYTSAVVSDMYAKSDYIIINAYTQYTFWDIDDMLSYEAVRKVFQKIKEDYDSHPEIIPRIGIPLIGAGLARGDWNKIEEIIDSFGFRDLTCVMWNGFEAEKVNRLDRV